LSYQRAPLAFLALLSTAAGAQTSAHSPAQTPAQPHGRPRPAAAEAKPDELPITRVALYKNGVGFFEHAGRVTGDQSVTIDFTSAQLNDVLQSLTAIDLQGGRIAGAGYNSTTPLDQQLKALPLALSDDPSDVDFYNAIRGARVQVNGPGVSMAGRLLSIDLRMTDKKEDNSAPNPITEKRFITVVSDGGQVRTLELTGAVSVTLLDSSLHTDVTRYLELLASTRNQGLRHLTLLDRGTGSRELRVSYISEVPVWKSTYRILFTDSATNSASSATLQGWSVVDNTTGSDWNNVHLDLIAGAPQSFIQPLSTPYYTRRPEIPLPAEAQLTPQTHDSGSTGRARTAGLGIEGTVRDATGASIPNARVNAINVATGEQANGTSDASGNYSLEVPTAGQYNVTISSPGFNSYRNQYVSVDGEEMASVDATLNVGSVSETVEVSAASPVMLASPKPMMARKADRYFNEGLAGLGSGGGRGIGAGYAVGGPVANYAETAQASITPGTTTSAFDDFFEYSLTDPIAIRKNESALVPILQTKLPVERVTLWSPQEPVALRALWITNDSNLTLDRGSFSIVENGSFGGEGLLDPIHPGEKRLLSYAADQAVRVTVDHESNAHTVHRFSIAKGVLTETSTDVAEIEYLVHNAAPDPRTVIVEQPMRQGWTLDSASGPGNTDPKPAETTATAYRFRVATQPRETVRLHIGERHTNYENIRLVDRSEEQFRYLVQGTKAGPDLLAALQPLFDLHNQVVALDQQIKQREAEIADISKDQDRLRENMKALKGTAEERQLLQRYTGELNGQEDRLATLRGQLADLHSQRNAKDAEFQEKMEALTFDETM
jgi:hypothetical protein